MFQTLWCADSNSSQHINNLILYSQFTADRSKQISETLTGTLPQSDGGNLSQPTSRLKGTRGLKHLTVLFSPHDITINLTKTKVNLAVRDYLTAGWFPLKWLETKWLPRGERIRFGMCNMFLSTKHDCKYVKTSHVVLFAEAWMLSETVKRYKVIKNCKKYHFITCGCFPSTQDSHKVVQCIMIKSKLGRSAPQTGWSFDLNTI